MLIFVSDIESATRFYRVLLSTLGYQQTRADPPEIGAFSFVSLFSTAATASRLHAESLASG